MKPAELLLGISGILIAGSIFLNSPALAGVATFLLIYYSSARMSFRGDGTVTVSLPHEVRELEWIRIPVKVENRFEIPGIVRIEIKGKDIEGDEVELNTAPGENTSAILRLRALRKGKVEPEIEAVFIDQTRFFKKPLKVEGIGPLTVYPSPDKLALSGRIRKSPNVFMEVGRALGIGTETLEFEELREYVPGDDLRRIDWRATSRFQKPIIRVFKRETPAEIKILLNTDDSFRRELSGKKVDYLSLILSQLIAYFAHHGHRVDIIAYNDKKVVGLIRDVENPRKALTKLDLKPLPGKPQLTPVPLGTGAKLRKFLKRVGMNSLTGIEQAKKLVSNNSYVIIIDDIGLHPNHLLGAAKEMKMKGCKVVILYPNPIYFISLKEVNFEELEAIYRGYVERKKLLAKMRAVLKIIEVSPKDLLPQVVERL